MDRIKAFFKWLKTEAEGAEKKAAKTPRKEPARVGKARIA